MSNVRIRRHTAKLLVAATVITCASALAAWAASFNNKSVKGTFSFHLSAVSPGGLSGAAGDQTINRVGIMEFDGKNGVVTGRTVSALDDGVSTVVVDYRWTGAYSVDSDGLGALTIAAPVGSNIVSCVDGAGEPLADCATAIGSETFAFVLVSGKKDATLSLIQTSAPTSARRAFLRGVATTQAIKKGGGGSGFSLF